MTYIKKESVSTSPFRSVSWTYDIETGRLFCSEGTEAIQDTYSDYLHFLERWAELYLPGYCSLVSESFSAFLKNHLPFELDIPLSARDGSRSKVQICGQAISDPEGRLRALKGSIQGPLSL